MGSPLSYDCEAAKADGLIYADLEGIKFSVLTQAGKSRVGIQTMRVAAVTACSLSLTVSPQPQGRCAALFELGPASDSAPPLSRRLNYPLHDRTN